MGASGGAAAARHSARVVLVNPAKTGRDRDMPITFEIDPNRRVLYTLVSGVVTYEELVRHLEEEERANGLGLPEVIDGRGATTDLTTRQVESLVRITDTLARKGRLGALAIVTDDDLAFGMARMYQLLTDGLPVRIGVFRELREATAWLRAAPPETH